MITKTNLLNILSSKDNFIKSQFFIVKKNSQHLKMVSNWDFTNFFIALVQTLKLFTPALLQTGSIERVTKERKMFDLIQKNIKYGLYLIDDYKNEIKIENKNFLSVNEECFADFSNKIMFPLLKNLYEKSDYNWEPLNNKIGLWREIAKAKYLFVNNEVYLNVHTNIKYIKM